MTKVMNNHPKTLAKIAERRKAGEDFSALLSEFLDSFYGAHADGEHMRVGFVLDALAFMEEYDAAFRELAMR
jgi:hypothetical protein